VSFGEIRSKLDCSAQRSFRSRQVARSLQKETDTVVSRTTLRIHTQGGAELDHGSFDVTLLCQCISDSEMFIARFLTPGTPHRPERRGKSKSGYRGRGAQNFFLA